MGGATGLRAPAGAELAEIATLSVRAGVFDDAEELVAVAHREPWRVGVSRSGDAVVLERWREHLDWLAMRAAWAAPRRMPELVESVRARAREHDLGTVLSPLVPAELADPYERSGMAPALRILVLRHELGASDDVAAPEAPPGTDLAEGHVGSLEEVLDLDRRCFAPEWAADHPWLERYLRRDRLVLARDAAGGPLLGFVLAGHVRGEASIGRLAVAPEARGTGLGRALVLEAVRGLASAGAPYVTLTTQADNAAAQRLYARLGFRTLRGELVGLTVPA